MVAGRNIATGAGPDRRVGGRVYVGRRAVAGRLAEVAEQAVEAGVAPPVSRAASRASARYASRSAGIEVAQVLLDGREVAAGDRAGQRARPDRARRRSAPTRARAARTPRTARRSVAASRSTWPSSATRWFDATTAAAW